MTSWLLKIETELRRAERETHPGRIRTAARRIAGIAIQRYEERADEDYLRMLQHASGNDALPYEVRTSIERLITRLDENFSSPSVDPIADAMIVVEFVKESVQ
ncbi:MAG: hypothetical protein WCW40_10550 [Bacteroidota bacterium]